MSCIAWITTHPMRDDILVFNTRTQQPRSQVPAPGNRKGRKGDFDIMTNTIDSSLLCFCQEAIAAESYVQSEPMCIQKGDWETGFASSDHVLEGEMRVGGQVGKMPRLYCTWLFMRMGSQVTFYF